MEDIIAARSIAENQGGPMGEAAAALAGMTSQDSVMFPGELSKAFVPQQDVQTEGFIPPTIGATELNTPAVRNAMAQPPSAGLATELMLAAQQGPAPDPNDEILAQARALLSDEANARIDYLKTMIDTLEEIISNIRWRHSTIKNMIDWRKFESGS
jgi:hypothetical protein